MPQVRGMNLLLTVVLCTIILSEIETFGVLASTKLERDAKLKRQEEAKLPKPPTMTDLQNMNLENAVKIYLAARGVLTPMDVTSSAPSSAAPPTRKHVRPKPKQKHHAPPPQTCILPEGCVREEAKAKFLQGKYIPGSDNILSPYYTVLGHMFKDTPPFDAEILNNDMKLYIMSRPRSAVPDASRSLLMPEGDDAWPGGNGENRNAYYPKTLENGQHFWETDVDPVKGADSAFPSPPPIVEPSHMVMVDSTSQVAPMQQIWVVDQIREKGGTAMVPGARQFVPRGEVNYQLLPQQPMGVQPLLRGTPILQQQTVQQTLPSGNQYPYVDPQQFAGVVG